MLRRILPILPILLALAVAAAAAGCATAGLGGASAAASGTPAGARSASPGGHGTSGGTPAASRGASGGAPAATPARTDVPEPARAPSLTRAPAGTVLPLPGAPEGLAVDDRDGLLAVGLRNPDGIALVSVLTGRVRKIVRLPGAPRHLQLAGPAGPVLVPAEQVGRLFQVALPGGAVVRTPGSAASRTTPPRPGP